MSNRFRNILFAADTVILSSKKHCDVEFPMLIVFDDFSSHKTHFISFSQNNVVCPLDIEEFYQVRHDSCEHMVTVSVYLIDTLVIKEEINICSNVIGSFNYSNGFYLSIVFRIIDKEQNDISIYNVPKMHLRDFNLTRKLGNGAFGTVYEAMFKNSKIYALKHMFQKIDIKKRDDTTIREIIPLICFPKHPCLIKLEGFIYDTNNGIILVLEHVSRGKISAINFENLDINMKIRLIYGLLSCVALLHDYKFVHRDICPDNVLVTENFEVKLIDFGVSRFLDNEMTKHIGHVEYMSPEVKYTSNYDEVVDDYSISQLIIKLNENYDDTIIDLHTLIECGVTCSEVCTIIESEIFFTNSPENDEYFKELNDFHKSKPVSDESIKICINILSNYSQFNSPDLSVPTLCDQYCDMIKLANNIGISCLENLYFYIVCCYYGIAFDRDYFDKDIFKKLDWKLNYSKEKIDIIFNFLLDYETRIYYKDKMLIIKITHLYFKLIMNVNFIIELENYFYKETKIRTIFPKLYELMKYDCNNSIFWTFLLRLAQYLIKNEKSIIDLYEYAASFGVMKACKFLATFCEHLDIRKSIHYAKIYLKNGKFKIADLIGRYYNKQKNYKKAFKYLSIAAKYGNSESMFTLGIYYMKGLFVEKDIQSGINCMKICANDGNPYAQSFLAYINFFGGCIPRNYSQAYYYNMFALKYKSAQAYFLNGLFYLYGFVVQQDFVQARMNFEYCLERNDIINNQRALYFLSIIHLLGLGVEVNVEKAGWYYKQKEPSDDRPLFGIIGYSLTDDSFILCRSPYSEVIERKEVISIILQVTLDNILTSRINDDTFWESLES